MRFRFRHLAAATTGLTFALILLGVYTAAAGAGLACGARWPLCNGAVFGLFPANWPSFIEWFHRLVAMVTGFFILGTTYAAWRHGKGRRTRIASTIALVVLPVGWLLLPLQWVTQFKPAATAGLPHILSHKCAPICAPDLLLTTPTNQE